MSKTTNYKQILPQQGNLFKWYDTRLYIPNPNSSCIYPVIWTECGLLFTGRARFSPINNYTDGIWEDATLERHNGIYKNVEVLYWMQNPELPEFLK